MRIIASRPDLSGRFSFMVSGFLVIVYCLLITVRSASAQSIPADVGGLSVTASTDNPAPGQEVTLTAESYIINMDSANIVWSAGGQIIASGAGKTSVTVAAPASGKELAISVTATAPNGTSLGGSITLGSGSVDIIVEPDGWTPPLFMGKIPPAYENAVRVVAVPHISDASGREYDPASLVYSWKRNSSVLESGSGYGKQSVVVPGSDLPQPYMISVSVSTRDGTRNVQGFTTVSPAAPSLAFYADDPLYGPEYNAALGNSVYIGGQRELGVIAAPYGFNVPAGGLGGLNLSWLINGAVQPDLSSSDAITLRAPGDTAGSSDVELDLSGTTDILQRAAASFAISFNAATTSQPSTVLF